VIDGTGIPESVLVLGAGSAIAQSVVAALVERGSTDIVLAARRPLELEPWLDSLSAGYCDVSLASVPFDANDIASHVTFIHTVWSEKRRFDMVLVAFGVMGASDAPDPHADAVTVATTNYLGALSITRLVATRMMSQGQGRAVVLSSAAALLPRAGQAAYASAKAGLDSFACGLALELHGSGVEVTIVRPGFVHSPMTRGLKPTPYATTPDDVARDIVRGLEKGSSVVWSPPIVRVITACARVLPRSVYRRVMSGR
jgi:decaprenylphospho-beta-D-erythro-pentofuranosid-2-ulose 2-reductase